MRQQQIHKEVRWVLWLTFAYVIGWVGFAYFSPSGRGWLGFPLWFELACIYLPVLFIVLTSIVIKLVFKNISLEGEKE